MVDILAGNTSHVTYTGSANRLYSGTVTATDNGTATEIQFWCQTSCNVKVAIYDAGSATRTRLGVNNTGTACTGGQINTVSISDVVLTQGTSYNLSIISDTANFLGLAATTGGDYEYWDYGSYAAGCPASYTIPTEGVFELSIAAYGTLATIDYEDALSTLSATCTIGQLDGYAEKNDSLSTLSATCTIGQIDGTILYEPDDVLGTLSATCTIGQLDGYAEKNDSLSTLSATCTIGQIDGTILYEPDDVLGTLSATCTIGQLDGYAEKNDSLSTLSATCVIGNLREAEDTNDGLGTLSAACVLGNLREAEDVNDSLSTLSAICTIGNLREAETHEDTLNGMSFTCSIYPIREVLSFPINSPNARSHAFHAEISRGCTLADTLLSLSSVEGNGGTVAGTATFDRFSGLTSEDGFGKVSYPSDGGVTDGSIVMAFKASSGGMIAGTASLGTGTPENGFCIWVDEDGIYASHSDGNTIATQCAIEGDFLDGAWHVVTYVMDLSDNSHTLYVDDESDTQSTSISGPLGASQRIQIGGSWTHHPNIVGSIRSFRLYNGTILAASDHNAYAT